MWCRKCNKDLMNCICPDLKERIEKIVNSPYILLPTCPNCQKPIYICECGIKTKIKLSRKADSN